MEFLEDLAVEPQAGLALVVLELRAKVLLAAMLVLILVVALAAAVRLPLEEVSAQVYLALLVALDYLLQLLVQP